MAEQWVEELREQFPVTRRAAFFDIAYENCGSVFVRDSMGTFFDHKADVFPGMVKAGGAGKGKTIGVIAGAREQLAHFLNAPGIKSLAFTYNTCHGINLVLQGFPFRPGDNIVVGDLEHPSVLMPCLYAKNRGVECRVVPARDGLILPAEDLLARVDSHTRMVVVSYVQSCSGYKVDLGLLGRECRRRGIFLVTDAIQALGFQQIDVQALGVDALASSCYKGLLGTEGVGFLYCSDRLLERLQPVFAGDSPALCVDRDTWTVCCTDPLDARKMEAGTIPFQSIYGIRAGLERLMEIGLARVERHVSDCFEEVYRGLEAMGYTIDTPFAKEHRCHSMVVRTPRSQEMVDFLFSHGVMCSQGRLDHIRISVAPFTNEADVASLLRAAQAWQEQACVYFAPS